MNENIDKTTAIFLPKESQPFVFHSAELKELGNPWWQFEDSILQFNLRLRVLSFPWLIIDDYMSAWRPRSTATGELPNIFYYQKA